ncbi:hypothetical protein B0H16DRAFT_1718866 [Mycena metata]|uniref:NmrA-like domain-containing protein n=1 Tax=Mycena metata TaxID=1033252 RepID=A0AAD7JI74_9AGAR|nr:hypothetical protein B0H16DRAFT_1718866 [Mycena metata]
MSTSRLALHAPKYPPLSPSVYGFQHARAPSGASSPLPPHYITTIMRPNPRANGIDLSQIGELVEKILRRTVPSSVEALEVDTSDAATAAAEAGVKLFMPSKFKMLTEGQTEGFPGGYLKTVGIPSTRIFNGVFLEGWAATTYGDTGAALAKDVFPSTISTPISRSKLYPDDEIMAQLRVQHFIKLFSTRKSYSEAETMHPR